MFSRHSKHVVALKDIELRLISELMKNSRRSDRELAKALGVSQPTVSRAIQRLEKEGIIKEYTIVPDFKKLGVGLLTMTFVKYKELGSEERAKAEKIVTEEVKKETYPQVVMIERGLGFTYDSVIVSYEKNYSDYRQLLDRIRTYEHIQPSDTQTFIIDLNDKVHYRSFTYQTLAKYLLTMQKQEKE
jgi:Lrp/AsnC family transcriptional regulator for asnA, asnC and gidA